MLRTQQRNNATTHTAHGTTTQEHSNSSLQSGTGTSDALERLRVPAHAAAQRELLASGWVHDAQRTLVAVKLRTSAPRAGAWAWAGVTGVTGLTEVRGAEAEPHLQHRHPHNTDRQDDQRGSKRLGEAEQRDTNLTNQRE